MFLSDDHELKEVSSITVSEVRGVESRRQKPRCDQHPALDKDMYCDTCHVPMCMKCCLLKHKQHEYRELDELAEETKGKLAELTQMAEKRYSVLGEHLKKLDVTKGTMKGDAEKACAEVCKATDELIDLVAQRKQTLIQEIMDIHAVAATEINAAYKETELNKASIQSLLSYIHALEASGDVSDQVVHTPGLQEQLRQQETSPLKSVSWTVDLKRNTENVARVDALLGTVSTEQTVDRPPVSVCDRMKLKLGSPLRTLTPKIEGLILGIAKLGDCTCVIGDGRSHLWMHNLKTNTIKQHTIPNLRACGLASLGNNSNTLIITDCKKKLHFITIDSHNMNITKQLTKDISFEPRRVVYDHTTDKLIIANRSDKQIVICSKTGDIEKRITLKAELTIMCALPMLGDAYMVLDYSNPGKVHWVNQSGDVTHTYGAHAGEHLNKPFNMVQDSDGRLVVADRDNHCVRLINNQQFSRDLITQSDGIRSPSCVYLDETAQTLYVGYQSGNEYKINMYKWPFTLTSPADTDTISKHFKLCVNLGRYQ